MSKLRKIIDEAKESKNPELDLVDKGISSFDEIPGLRKFSLHKSFQLLLMRFIAFSFLKK